MTRDEAYDLLDRLARGIAEMFGASCETIIHDFSQPNHPILAIYNGHVSGRQVGSTRDLTGLEQEVALQDDVVNLLATTPSGQKVKSSTFVCRGKDYHFALGVNFDFTALVYANRQLMDLMRVDADFRRAVYQDREGHIGEIFAACVEASGKPVCDMSKADRLRVIGMLEKRGAFSYRKAVPYVAERLGVSRYTIYKYLDEITGGQEL